MTSSSKKFSVIRITANDRITDDATVVSEFPLTVILNDQELVTLLCSPENMDYLALGFLFAEGILDNSTQIKQITTDERLGIVRVTTMEGGEFSTDLLFKRLITSACGRGAGFYSAADTRHIEKVEARTEISAGQISSLVEEFNQRSRLFRTTGGVHSAALSDGKSILVFGDDLGRHNAVDKVFGECLLKDITTEGRIILTSGRVPSEMVLKAGRGKVPILVSVGATSDLGIRLANDLGVTLIGFARGKDMTVYTNDWRVTSV